MARKTRPALLRIARRRPAADPAASLNERIWSTEIRQAEHIGSRGFRKWIAQGKFPPPDGNFAGRNFWFRGTYERWKADVAAGRYAIRKADVIRRFNPVVGSPTEAA